MEHNSRLDKEILALRARVQTLDLERKTFLDLVSAHPVLACCLGQQSAVSWQSWA